MRHNLPTPYRSGEHTGHDARAFTQHREWFESGARIHAMRLAMCSKGFFIGRYMEAKRLNKVEEFLAGQRIEGNIIPLRWFQVIGTVNRYGQFKANLLAINIMAELVYWYRPVEVRDETAGESLGYRSKFEADMYQLAYRHAKVKFGASKKSVKAACDSLVKLGAIKREFRHIVSSGKAYANVMFVQPEIQWLQANLAPIPTKKATPSPPKGAHRTTQKVGTYTETSNTETSTDMAFWPDSKPDITPNLNKINRLVEEYSNKICKVDRVEVDFRLHAAIAKNGLTVVEQCLEGALQAQRDETYNRRYLPGSLSSLLQNSERVNRWSQEFIKNKKPEYVEPVFEDNEDIRELDAQMRMAQ